MGARLGARTRAVLCCVILLLLAPLNDSAVADPFPDCPGCVFSRVTATPDGFGAGSGTSQFTHSAGARPAPERRRTSPAAKPNGPLIEYDYRNTCDLPGGNGGCAGGTLKCTARDTQSVFVAQRQVTPTVGPWTLQPGSVCLTPAQQLPWSPAQLQAFVDGYFRRLPLPLPALTLQPADRAVVNLPLIASSNAPAQTTFTVNQAPFPTITIRATVNWQWSWGDGTSTGSSWPGRAYDGTDPRSSPGHYISHPYTAPSNGTTITVTTTWTGRYSIAGGGEQAINGTVQRSSSRTLPVSEYGATITG